MRKAYFLVAILSAILYPFALSLITSSEVSDMFILLFGDFFLSIAYLGGVAFGAIFGLLLIEWMTQGVSDKKSNDFTAGLIRIFGAIVAGLIPVFALYVLITWRNGYLPSHDLSWWLILSIPGFISTSFSYIIVSLLMGDVVKQKW